jgi:hypothetical protein
MYLFYCSESCFKRSWHKLETQGFKAVYVDMSGLFWQSTVILIGNNKIVTLQCNYNHE